jgi:hypothetical protein
LLRPGKFKQISNPPTGATTKTWTFPVKFPAKNLTNAKSSPSAHVWNIPYTIALFSRKPFPTVAVNSLRFSGNSVKLEKLTSKLKLLNNEAGP